MCVCVCVRVCVCVCVLQTQSCLAVFQFTVGRLDFDTVYAEARGRARHSLRTAQRRRRLIDSFVCPALAGRLFCARLHGVFALGTSQIACSAHFSTSPSPCAPSRTPWVATATLPCAVVAHECLLGAPAGSTSGRRV